MNFKFENRTDYKKRQDMLARLKKERLIEFTLISETPKVPLVEEDDGLTIPDFRKTLQR